MSLNWEQVLQKWLFGTASNPAPSNSQPPQNLSSAMAALFLGPSDEPLNARPAQEHEATPGVRVLMFGSPDDPDSVHLQAIEVNVTSESPAANSLDDSHSLANSGDSPNNNVQGDNPSAGPIAPNTLDEWPELVLELEAPEWFEYPEHLS